MADIKRLHEQADELERLLRLQTYPVGVKLLRSVDEVPEGAKRPVKDLGYHLSLCQAIALARRAGMTIAEAKEDMWCFEPVIGLGFEKPPQRFLDGHNRYPFNTSTLEAGATWARNLPRLDYGLYKAVVVAPLAGVNFEPDILLLYGDPSKIHEVLSAKNWLDGKDPRPALSGNAACIYAIAPAMKDKVWQFTIPCLGDIRRAACDSCDMIFSAPIEVMDGLLEGLRAAHKTGKGLPRQPNMSIEYPQNPWYMEIGKMLGMDWLK